jgi:membrane-associated phospholipid phosphatase
MVVKTYSKGVRFDAEPRVDDVPRPATPGEHIAHWISQIGSPPIVALAGFVVTLAHLGTARAWLWVALYSLLGLVGPLLFLFWQLRRGDVTDLDIHFRQQRKWSLLVTATGFAAAWASMLLARAPGLLLLMVGTGLLQWIAVYLISLRWKISIHSASVSGVVLFVLWAFGLSAVPVTLAVPLVSWSRVKLRRHTPAQVIGGILLGSAAFSIALVLSPTVRTPGLLGH